MRIKDFNRLKETNKKKWTECVVYVDDIGEVDVSPAGGLQQKFRLILGEDIPTTEMTYYFQEEISKVEAYESPNQTFKIMWMKKDDGGYWKCLPCEAKPMPEDLEKVAVDRQVLIVRQTCIKAAAEVLKSCSCGPNRTMDAGDTAIGIAKKFEQYILGE